MIEQLLELDEKAASKRDPQVSTITSYLSGKEDDKVGSEFKKMHLVVAMSNF